VQSWKGIKLLKRKNITSLNSQRVRQINSRKEADHLANREKRVLASKSRDRTYQQKG
jgi:hypothetical protein